MTPDDIDRFQEDVNALVATLAEAFKATEFRHFIQEETETLYVSLKGLETFTEEQIQALAVPILDEIDLDFDEIILLPID
jgi:hypothetical protein